MEQLNSNLTPNTPLSTSRTSTPFQPATSDPLAQFPLLTAYHSAVDPIAYITTTISSHGDAFVSELTNFLNHANQTNGNYHSLQTLHQGLAIELDSLRLVNSDLQAQL
jgi:hypothetical protein